MGKTVLILVTAFCLIGVIVFIFFLDGSPAEENLDGFDFIEHFFEADMNYSMTAEGLDEILSTCAGTTIDNRLNSRLNMILSAHSAEELTGAEGFRSLPASPDSVIRIIFQPEDDFITDFELRFRGRQNPYLLSSEANNLVLAREKEGKTEELARWKIDRTKDKFGRIILNVAFFKKQFLVYNGTSNLAIGYHNSIEEGGNSSQIRIKNNNSMKPGKVFYKVAGIKQKDLKRLTDSLILMRLLNDRNVSYWNRLYPEHMVPIKGQKSPFLQRIDKDFSNSRTILLPADSTISWDVFIPDEGYLDFGLALMMKNTFDPKVLRLLVNVKDTDSGEELELTYDVDEKQFWSYKWYNRRLKLDRFHGRECRITLKGLSYPGASMQDKKTVLLLANPVIRRPRKIDEKNIILISLDTLRADHLGCYGYKRDTSPNIDESAAKGIILSRAVSSAPWTLPSHLSILSSLYPLETGYRQIRESDEVDMWRHHYNISRMADEVDTLAEVLKKNNYQTRAMTLGGLVGPIFGFDQGFERYSWKGKVYKDVEKEIDYLIKWIRRNKKNKFFMFFHTYEIHDPYTRRYFTDYDKMNDVERIIANYDSGIHYTDRHLNTLFKYLKKEKLWDNTVIIITSDHGENFAPEMLHDDAGGHGGTLYDCELHVPLIILGGGFDRGIKINDQVQSVDIMPTLLDMIGLEPESEIRGISLLPLIRGEKIRPRIAYSEAVLLRPESWDKHSVRTNERKLIRNFRDDSGKEERSLEYYDLADDPAEKENIAAAKDNWMESLLRYLDKISESVLKQGKKLPMNKFSDENSLNDEVRKELKALGYLG